MPPKKQEKRGAGSDRIKAYNRLYYTMGSGGCKHKRMESSGRAGRKTHQNIGTSRRPVARKCSQ